MKKLKQWLRTNTWFCQVCQKEISDDIDVCPRCGA